MKPPAKILWLGAAVMGVLWAIIASAMVPLLVLGFGRGGGPARYWGLLVAQAVVVALLCARSYWDGWHRGRNDQKHLQGGSHERPAA